jgi:uncharacterized protein YndB with AHSA1/START domain
MTDLPKTDSASAGPSVREEGQGRSRSVVTECDLPDAPEKVWKALTARELLARWLPDVLESELLNAEPHRLLRYRWPADERDRDPQGHPLESVVTFELSVTSGGGTHLRVIHRLSASAVAARSAMPEGATVVPFRKRRSQDPVALALRWAA